MRANPLAGDTKEGITQWWLGMTAGSAGLVENALDALQAAGALVATRAADGQVRYRRASFDAAADAQLDRLISMPTDGWNE